MDIKERKENIEKFGKDTISFMDCLVTDFKNKVTELTEEEIIQMAHSRR